MAFEGMNWHIHGAPKIWFIVPPEYHDAFCKLVAKLGLTDMDRQCVSYLQHKFIFVDPREIVKAGVPVHTIIQRPGDIVYVLPNTIHWGFNGGLNFNEAVNFASKSWARPGMLCPQRCYCDSVHGLAFRFDISQMLTQIGFEEDTIRQYRNGRLKTISDELRFLLPQLHPEAGVSNAANVKLENLLGPTFTDVEQLGKYWKRHNKGLDLDGFNSYIGGFEDVDLTEDPEKSESEEDDNRSGSLATDLEDELDMVVPSDGGEEQPASSSGKRKGGKILTCPDPSCHRTYKGGMTKRLRTHIERDHKDHPQQAEFRKTVDAQHPPKNKTEKRTCSICGKEVAGRGSQMKSHQQSRNCKVHDENN